MAVTVAPLGSGTNPLRTLLDTVAAATAVRAYAGACTLYGIFYNNAANAAEEEHLKLYDAELPVPGTTVPEHIIMIPRAGSGVIHFTEGMPAFATAMSYAATTQAGTAGTTPPTASLVIRLLFKPS